MEQATSLQRLAWNVVKNYPDWGLYETGTERCAKAEFIQEDIMVRLHSGAAEAWFRYTLDGTEPTRANGYVFCGKISMHSGTSLKVVAYRTGRLTAK